MVQHLHGSDKMAVVALRDADEFNAAKLNPAQVQTTMNPTIEGSKLLETWWSYFNEMCQLLGDSDPKRRFHGSVPTWVS